MRGRETAADPEAGVTFKTSFRTRIRVSRAAAKLYAARKASGVCLTHPSRPVVAPHVRCDECQDYMRRYNRTVRCAA